VQQTHRHARRLGGAAPAYRDDASTAGFAHPPGFTHSQRCLTQVIARDLLRPVPLVRMLAALDAVLVRVCNTLPRDAELACVHRAHAAPQFIEDAVRAAATAVANLWPRPGAFRSVAARARSLESIHEYDLTAAITLRAPVPPLPPPPPPLEG
jgi:GTP cyclohydrolase FolE2